MYSIRDILPWSLVYGAQNEQHSKELKALEVRCTELEVEVKELSCMAVRRFLLSSLVDFANRGSNAWKDWRRVKKNITADDIKDVEAQVCRDLPGETPWFSSYIPEMRFRAQSLRADLARL